MNTIGEKIYTMRMSRGMTQGDLASAINVCRSLVSMWENDLRIPRFEDLEALADIFNVDMSTFKSSEDVAYNANGLSSDERELIEVYRLLTNEGKARILEEIKMYAGTEKFAKKAKAE